nr:solute carrier family 2, facilitated glucose transporter member 8-like [Leptinotarsa decemlineata]XP_023015023.1 solute carrier family 2, facilitated glucose transporter member 8-like [Leptinotarsa decemlineata]XP_023015024.1 solute carrier family 2, facilitated glucose transporter member 8-like [Leptinotarsa decemlineata]
MEADDKIGMGAKIEAVTYVFGSDQEKKMLGREASGLRTKLWQVLPVACASLSCLPFGLMLGWPSPTNPILLKPDSVIPISIDQSAMIAGFLMIGNTLGTPLSRKCFIESKYGLLLGITFMTLGWFLMWQARDIYWLLGSRLLVGFGNGYGVGQLKIYISELCDDGLATTLTKQINLYVCAAMVAVFSFGPFLDFGQTSFIALMTSIVVFFLLMLLPSTPVNLVKAKQAGKLISFLRPSTNTSEGVNKIVRDLGLQKKKEFGLWEIIRDGALCRQFLIFAFLVFCQQWSGAPATLTYAQIMFDRSRCPHAPFLAIAYAATFFVATCLGLYFAPRFDKRKVLLLSSLSVIFLTAAKVCVIFFRLNETYWSYSSVPVMFVYIVTHTVGLGSLPVTLIGDLFPKECRIAITHFFVMFHSMLALIVTKVFQVLISRYNVGVGFCLFFGVSVVAFIFIYFFLPKKTEQTKSINIFVASKDQFK